MIFTAFMFYLLVGLFTVLSILCEARWTGSKSDYEHLYDGCTNVASVRWTWFAYTWVLFLAFWLWPIAYWCRWKDIR